MKKIKLSQVYQALDMVSQESHMFIDFASNEIIEIYDFYDEDEKEKMYEMIDLNRENYFRLPDQYEMNNYSMMEKFIFSLDNTEHQQKLLYTIKGKGAFRRFKDALIMLDIRDKWFKFKENELIEMARSILDENQIEYIDDLT